MAGTGPDEELAALATMSSAQLRRKWTDLIGKPVPRVSPSMLRLALAWEMQAAVHGKLSRQAQQKLEQYGAGKTETRVLRPGMRLVREWDGRAHVVTVDDDGSVNWNGRRWNSLSQVAREITGTRWSGPAFFGLKTRKAA